jgi:tetratricopeptide (TPR) repeat protein
MASVPELLDRGMKLYSAGRMREAREAFQLALDLDPHNAKARSYLVHIREAMMRGTPLSEGLARVSAAVEEALHTPEPVPLPAPVRPQPAPAPAPVQRGPAPSAGGGAGGSPADEPHGEEYAPSPWDDGPAAPATIELGSTSEGLDLDAVAEQSDLRPLVPEGARPPAAAAGGPKNDVEVWLSAAKELFSLGDFSGSLELIEKILQLDPDHGEARDYLRQNEATLVSMYESKLGSLTRVPRLAIKPEEVMWLNLDHRAGFLLAQIDGTVDFDSLFALSGLPRLDTARILANLIADGVITS